MDMISSLALAAIAGLILTMISLLQELAERRKKKKEPTLQDRISELTKSLKSAVDSIAEIEAEVLKRKKLITQQEKDIERYKRLMEINQSQVEAIAQTLSMPVRRESRKSFLAQCFNKFLNSGSIFRFGLLYSWGLTTFIFRPLGGINYTMKLGVIIVAAIFLAAGLISLFSGSWQAGIILIFIGLALGLFFFRS